MALTQRQLNRATLARQMLLAREPVSVTEAVDRIVAIQAQHPASPYVALWNRIDGFSAAELDRAFSDATIVKASLMRITLHAVSAADYPSFHEAMAANLRASRLHDRRFTSTGLTIEDADAALRHVVEFASEPRTGPEIHDMLAERLGSESPARLWWALRTFAPLRHAPTDPIWAFGRRPSFQAAPAHPPWADPDSSLRRLVWRYLEGFGPASEKDFAQFALQRMPATRAALAGLDDQLVRSAGPDGVVLFDVPDAPLPPEDAVAPPRVLAMWDSILLCYSDRSRTIPEEYRKRIIRTNGDVLPTVLVDGFVAGVWRPTADGIEVSSFRQLTAADWDGIEHEAATLRAFLSERDPRVYSGYDRWWSDLEMSERRLLAG